MKLHEYINGLTVFQRLRLVDSNTYETLAACNGADEKTLIGFADWAIKTVTEINVNLHQITIINPDTPPWV